MEQELQLAADAHRARGQDAGSLKKLPQKILISASGYNNVAAKPFVIQSKGNLAGDAALATQRTLISPLKWRGNALEVDCLSKTSWESYGLVF